MLMSAVGAAGPYAAEELLSPPGALDVSVDVFLGLTPQATHCRAYGPADAYGPAPGQIRPLHENKRRDMGFFNSP